MAVKKRKKDVYVRDVAAHSVKQALIELDEMNKGLYDMYPISIEPYEKREGYVRIRVIGWENADTREYYDV